LACSAAWPLWVPGICRMPGRSSSARKRAPADAGGRSAATIYGMGLPSGFGSWLARPSGQAARHPVREHRLAGDELRLEGRMLGQGAAWWQRRLVDLEAHHVFRVVGRDREALHGLRQDEAERVDEVAVPVWLLVRRQRRPLV